MFPRFKNVSVALLLPLFFLFITSMSVKAKGGGKQLNLRLMTYNVRHLEGEDGIVSSERIAHIISAVRPDVVALQELDSVNGRTLYADQLAELAWYTGMYATWATVISYAGGGYGVGMLTRERPLSVRRIPLPGSEPRMLLIVELSQYIYACTHLDLTEQARLASVDIIKREAARSTKPFFIAGDLNAEPHDEPITRLSDDFQILNDTTQMSFPASKPGICIDYILVSKGSGSAKMRRSRVLNQPTASDHRPLVVDLTLRRK